MRKENEGQAMLRPGEVAERLGVCRRTVLASPLRERLPWVRLGARTLRLDVAALEAFTRGRVVIKS